MVHCQGGQGWPRELSGSVSGELGGVLAIFLVHQPCGAEHIALGNTLFHFGVVCDPSADSSQLGGPRGILLGAFGDTLKF